MSDLTDRLDEIQARADAATEGTLRASLLDGVTYEDGSSSHVAGIYPGSTPGPPPVFITRSIDRRDAEFIAHARTDVPLLVGALKAVLDVIGPHYAAMLRRETKFGRTRSSCCCEQCRAVQAIADTLGVDGEEKNDDR